MTPFEFITVALSFILGLGVTQLLVSAIGVFRARDQVPVDWIPLAWAAVVLLLQLQYWWACYELDTIVHVWTLLHFVVLVLLALLLFIAGALVLPAPEQESPERLRSAFQRDGRWALLCLSVYFGFAVATNWYLFDMSPMSLAGASCIVLGLLPLLFLRARRRAVQAAIVLIDFPLSIAITVFVMSPTSY